MIRSMNASRTRAWGLAMGLALSGCGPAGFGGAGQVSVQVNALVAREQIARLVAEIAPARVVQELSYNARRGTFEGELMLPVGEQEVVVRAYDQGDQPIAEGRGTVRIERSAQALLTLRVLDTKGSQLQPDYGPLITSFGASTKELAVGEEVTLQLEALDPDGQELIVQWKSSCPGSFSAPGQRKTAFVPTAAGSCVIEVSVSDGQWADAMEQKLEVLATVSGSLRLEGSYVARPEVSRLSLQRAAPEAYRCILEPGSADHGNATCGQSTRAGLEYVVKGEHGKGSARFSDTCHGTWSAPVASQDRTRSEARWKAPLEGDLCLVFVEVTNDEGLMSRLSLATWVEETPGK
jgi:hypothetical protein